MRLPGKGRNLGYAFFVESLFPLRFQMIQPAKALRGLAQSYCQLIEGACQNEPDWLAQVADLLPRLHAVLIALRSDGSDLAGRPMPDLDARFELFGCLRDRLGERDHYWLEFDPIGDGEAMTGSLADDLTDIYYELRQGLSLAESLPLGAGSGWLAGFEAHWGRHLSDAERHLANLAAQGRLVS